MFILPDAQIDLLGFFDDPLDVGGVVALISQSSTYEFLDVLLNGQGTGHLFDVLDFPVP